FERANPGRLLPVVDRVKGNLVPAAFSASPVETPDPSQRRPLRGHSRKALPADLCAARRLTLLSACARRSDDTEAFLAGFGRSDRSTLPGGLWLARTAGPRTMSRDRHCWFVVPCPRVRIPKA